MIIDALKSKRRFLLLFCIAIGLAPFTPEPHLLGKIRWVMGGAVGMQSEDWFDLLYHGAPWILLLLSFIPTEKSKKMQELIKNGQCTIIDVRTPAEFMGGHVAGSKNIPLNEIAARIDELKEMQMPLILCCASGMRSGQATAILNKEGVECYNGGPWTAVNGMTA
jgi:phage shock protein E